MHYDDKANISLIQRLNTRGQLWNKDVGNLFGNLKNKNPIFAAEKDCVGREQRFSQQHSCGHCQTFRFARGSGSQTLMFAGVAATYANAEEML